MTRFVEPVTLTGDHFVRLEPLTADQVSDIAEAAADSDNDTLWFTSAPSATGAADWVQRMLSMQESDQGVTFVVRRRTDNAAVGSTSLFHVDAGNRRLEIGHTWYSQTVRRTGINTETKLLLLTHVFDHLDCVAVEFRTHFFNRTSRAAIERLGAKQDGVLRSHQIAADGSRRDTVVYSILDIEWPAVRANLIHRLARHA